uniref:Uncharacterized protein n=2 Tax=Caulerpa ashmeadii TaxID=177078 RepID=A0A6B9VXB4_9CHLO|nr:hypothetical protein [Caulerpa ashmeadii]QHQ73295.1 hypothetical protein [Caulerpa ashmeadii]
MYKFKPKSYSSGKTIKNLGSATRLTHKKNFVQEDVLVNDTTSVVDLFQHSKIMHETPVIYQEELDLEIQQSLVNELPSPSVPTKLDVDAAYQQFKENMADIAFNQLYLEKDQNRNLLLIESRLLGHRVSWSKIHQIDVGLEAEIDAQVSSQSFERVQASAVQDLRQKCILENVEYTHSQVMKNLTQMVDGEILEQQEKFHFDQVSEKISLETAVQDRLDKVLELLENHLNELKTVGQLKENRSEIGIEPIGIKPIAPNQIPQAFVYAGGRPQHYLGNGGSNGPDGGGSNGPGGGGSNGPGGGDDLPDGEGGPGLGYFALMILFWGTLISTFKTVSSFILNFMIDRLNFNGLSLLEILEKLFGQEQIEDTPPEGAAHQLEVKPPGLTARLPSLVPLTVAAAGLVAWSYFLSPENLLRCLNLFFNLSAMLGRSFGRLLLYVIPQPLQGVAILLGNGVAQVLSFTRRRLIPAIMLSRTLMVLGLKLYVLLKLATFGVELCRLFSALSPPWFKKGVQQVAEAVESSNQIEEVGLITENPFLFGFLKSVVVFLLPFIPLPENKGIKFACWALLLFLINRDTDYFKIFIGQLMEVPSVVTLTSCIFGRFACIFIALNLSKDLKDTDFKAITWLFYGSLYYYKVFGLALRASSNLLPV